MEAQNTERRLAAIFAADVVGYSRLMSEREEATLTILHACLDIFHTCILTHHGRVFGSAGDSVIAEFPSAVEAVRCAVKIQQAIAQRNDEVADEDRMQFRIGINVGDVIVEGDNLMGEGVNIASRLEGIAEPDGINISADVYHQVHNKVEARFQDLGIQSLKNIPEPIQIYRVVTDPSIVITPIRPERAISAGSSQRWRMPLAVGFVILFALGVAWFATQHKTLPPPHTETASIAVLPFANMSGDPEQEYFVDGITEDIITEFSRLSNLTVIAWTTSSSYKEKTVKPRDVGKDLGVGYVLDGSVRKAGDRLRITAQLVDTGNNEQVWAERYDRKLTQIFELQDEVTNKIVNALSVRVTKAEKEKLGHSGTNNLEAYDSLLRGLQYFRQRTKEGFELAHDAYRRAIELDPTYARAYGALAVLRTHEYRRGWTGLSAEEAYTRALELAQKAVALDRSSQQAYWALGYVYLFRKQYNEAAVATRQAVTLAPNYADGYGLLAFINNWQGKGEDAIRDIHKAMTLNPHYTFDYPWNLGMANYTLGRYTEAVEALHEALTRNENALLPRLYLAASYVRLGKQDDAEWEIEQAMVQSPSTSISLLANTLPYENSDQMNVLLEDLRKAGLPD
jgi:adenylate cyclase